MELFDKLVGVAVMIFALVCLVAGRVDLATYNMALVAAHFARIAAFK